jgi:hypothetical protein
MKAFFSYAIILSLGLAVGFIVKGPLNLEDVATFKWLDEITAILNKAFVPAKPAADVVLIDPAAAALIDEDLDYRIAQRIGSLEGWRSFLAAHGSSTHAQSAREEAQVLAGKAPAQVVAEVSNGASTDAKAANEIVGSPPPSAETEVAEAQVLAGEPPVTAEVSNGPFTDPKAGTEAGPSVPPSPGTEVAALGPDEICNHEGDRLERLRNSPTSDEAARFANELGCEKLRPQLLGLMESLGYAIPAQPSAPPNPSAKVGSTFSPATTPASRTRWSASSRGIQPRRHANRCAFKSVCFSKASSLPPILLALLGVRPKNSSAFGHTLAHARPNDLRGR